MDDFIFNDDLYNDAPFYPELPNYNVPENSPIPEEKSTINENKNGREIQFSCIPVITPTDTIREFVNNNPTSFIVIPTSERGLLRLSRNIKSGYKVALLYSIRDLLNKK